MRDIKKGCGVEEALRLAWELRVSLTP